MIPRLNQTWVNASTSAYMPEKRWSFDKLSISGQSKSMLLPFLLIKLNLRETTQSLIRYMLSVVELKNYPEAAARVYQLFRASNFHLRD